MRACKVRGALVKYILCDAIFAECDMYGAAMSASGRPLDLCEKCQAAARTALEQAELPYHWLSEYLNADERKDVFQWAQTLDPKNFHSAKYGHYRISEQVQTSVVSYFRSFPIRMDDWHTVNVFRGFLHAAALASIGVERILDSWQPDAIVLFNGRLSVLRVAFNLARERGIRVLVHERPRTTETLFVVENAKCTSPVPFQQFWRVWRSIALSRRELDQVSDWLRARRHRPKSTEISFGIPPQGTQQLRRALNLSESVKLIALFTTSTDEFSADPELQGPFPTQEIWIEKVVEWVSNHPECTLVIRAHPSLSGRGGIGFARSQVEWFEALKARVPANVIVVMPADILSSYDLMDLADLGCTYGSTTGLEMLALGKPVALVPGFAIYEDLPGIVRLSNPQKLEEQLDELLTLKPSREYRRFAFRCIYRAFFSMQIPFSLVSMVGQFESKLNYASIDALKPGLDAQVDRICNFLLRGEPIFPGPNLQELNRSNQDENDFLDGLDGNPSWLEDNNGVAQHEPKFSTGEKSLRYSLRMLTPLLRMVLPVGIRQRVPTRIRRALQ